jgi:uncharacterized DUF497 family protein
LAFIHKDMRTNCAEFGLLKFERDIHYLLVAHSHIDSDDQEIVRIISARHAERKERKTYEEHAIK